jgi:hypothetical protein
MQNNSKNMIYKFFFVLSLILSVSNGCNDKNCPTLSSENKSIVANVKKWFHDKKAAISVTIDIRWRDDLPFSTQDAIDRGLKLEFEMVTAEYLYPWGPSQIAIMRDSLYNNGIRFFGHGHKHYAHDTLSYDEAYNSFLTCYNLMQEWGLKPKGYAYPHSSGWLARTQKANREAGWLFARGYTPIESEYYICPDNIEQPTNWYYLPSVFITSDPTQNSIHSHNELTPILNNTLDKSAWVILMYHSINYPNSWGYYPIEEWNADVDFIASKDFWIGHMEEIALYIMERHTFELAYEKLWETESSIAYEIRFIDHYLDNTIYNQPLSIELDLKLNDQYKYAIVSPKINNKDTLSIDNNSLNLDIIPDENRYKFIFYK